jgi:hypothetical protein
MGRNALKPAETDVQFIDITYFISTVYLHFRGVPQVRDGTISSGLRELSVDPQRPSCVQLMRTVPIFGRSNGRVRAAAPVNLAYLAGV